MKLLKKLNDEGMTIIQVTHNEKYAGYGSRIIQLEDGLVRADRLIETIGKVF
jgi:ABC-type lipoprotein export system ATPase subunit